MQRCVMEQNAFNCEAHEITGEAIFVEAMRRRAVDTLTPRRWLESSLVGEMLSMLDVNVSYSKSYLLDVLSRINTQAVEVIFWVLCDRARYVSFLI